MAGEAHLTGNGKRDLSKSPFKRVVGPPGLTRRPSLRNQGAAMQRVIIKAEKCKQCGYCVEFCPRQALAFGARPNAGGYNPVTLDSEKCVACGTCYLVCPDFVFSINPEGTS